MILRKLAPLAGACVIFAACSGSGSSTTSPIPNRVAASQKSAAGTLMIGMPHRAAGKRRKPGYVAPSTTFVTLWIDADTTGFRQACSPSASQCTLNWTSYEGDHTFAVEIDDSAAIGGGGTVLAEGNESVTLTPGSNLLPPMTLNGVPASIDFVSETIDSASDPPCQALGAPINCVDIVYGLSDADGNYLVSPGLVDNGGIQVFSSAAYQTPATVSLDSFGNDYTGVISCFFNATGALTVGYRLYANGGAGTPGELSPAQVGSYALTYPDQTALPMLNWPVYQCTAGTISTN